MFAHVTDQITLLAKDHHAIRIWAHMLLLVLMYAKLVLLQRNLLSESLVALITRKLFFMIVGFFKVGEVVMSYSVEQNEVHRSLYRKYIK